MDEERLEQYLLTAALVIGGISGPEPTRRMAYEDVPALVAEVRRLQGALREALVVDELTRRWCRGCYHVWDDDGRAENHDVGCPLVA